MATSDTVEIDRDALENLAEYVEDDLRNHGGPEMDYLEDAVRDAYAALDR